MQGLSLGRRSALGPTVRIFPPYLKRAGGCFILNGMVDFSSLWDGGLCSAELIDVPPVAPVPDLQIDAGAAPHGHTSYYIAVWVFLIWATVYQAAEKLP